MHQAEGACGWREGFRRDAGEYKPLPQRPMFRNKNQEVDVEAVSMDIESDAVETRKRTRGEESDDGSGDDNGWNNDIGEGEDPEEERELDHTEKRSKSLLYDRVGRDQ